MSDHRPPSRPPGRDDEDTGHITAPLKEIERRERRAFFAKHRALFIAVAALAFALVTVAGSIGFFVGRVREEPELVTVSDDAPARPARDELRPAPSDAILAAFFSGVLEGPGGRREAVTLRFGEAEVEGRGWLQAAYVVNGPATRERGVALLQPAATRLLLGSGESLEVGLDDAGRLVVRGGEGRRVRMRSKSP